MSLLVLPILAQAFSVIVGDTSEVRTRSDELGQHFDISTTGRISLNLALRRVKWTLLYSPNLSELNIGESMNASTQLIQAGALTANLRLGPRTNAMFSEYASYGQQNFRVLALSAPQLGTDTTGGSQGTSGTSQSGSTGPASGQTGVTSGPNGPVILPTYANARVTFGSTSSSIGISHRLDQTWSTSVFAGYTVGGGLNVFSQQTVPLARNYSAGSLLSHVLTPVDRLTLTASASYTSTLGDINPLNIPGTNAFISILSVTWTHRLIAHA